ncbi:hypothetical protein Cgig2_006318 [Carnegiea gigantea]|uniref:DUF4283 domain-containing protein n=1 Tax=Carnegiea gigantea TaxID=171969 RepID=A0A9Q1GS76_9CARY|nr:hypothetical protein Cgig2_006318 [Carnegiea gigantea]
MEEVLHKHEELDLWFIDVKKWDQFDYCETRRVWLEILGVPLHGWKLETCKKKNCSYMAKTIKVLIDTNRFNTINGVLIISLEGVGYTINVKEISLSIQVIQTTHTLEMTPSMEAMDSNDGAVGSKDITDDVVSTDDMAYSDLRRNDRVFAMQDREVVKET